MADWLFTYGTLQFPEVMQAVSGSLPHWVDAQVYGYAQYRLVDRTFPGIIAESNRVTTGRLYVDVGAVAWGLLDRFEDPFYERQDIEVWLADGTCARAQAYVLPSEAAHLLSGEPWTMSGFAEEHLVDYVNRCRLFYHMITLT